MPAESLRGRRVVLVDDDRQILELFKIVLEQAGCVVTAFNRYEDAKKYLSDTTPDILLTDVRLGGHNGMQLAVLGKLAHPEMLAVVVSAHDDPVLKHDAEHAGARYLVKPVTPSELLATLTE